MPNYDLTDLALQIAAPNNVLMYDDLGDPSVMVRIPKFTIGEVIEGAATVRTPLSLSTAKNWTVSTLASIRTL